MVSESHVLFSLNYYMWNKETGLVQCYKTLSDCSFYTSYNF